MTPWIIVGPTAVGKTNYAMTMALRENGEIISADSGQIYRGIDIGTAKPTAEERRSVPFHLIDIIDPSQRFNAADFRKLAWKKIDEIHRRGNKVLVVGGTGLYIKVLEEGIFKGPSADLQLRQQLEERIGREGVESLYRELQKVDPVAAKKIPARNRQRIIRALEVYEVTGRPISEFWGQTSRTGQTCLTEFKKIGLTLPREALNRRIEERVDRMMARGWLEETQTLLKKWGEAAPALKVIGYKELVLYLTGKIDCPTAIALIKTHTRQYAKRQLTWFKRDHEIRWSQIS